MKTASELENIIMIKELKIQKQNLEIERQKEIIKQLDIKNLELTTIIKEVREYTKEHSYDYRVGGIAKVNGKELLEILDKEK